MRGDNVEAITSGKGVKLLGFRFFKGFFQSNQVQAKEGFPNFLKYRFTDFQAKIGLKRLESVFYLEKRRIENTKYFYSHLNDEAKKMLIEGIDNPGATFWKCPLWVERPSEFKEKASQWGIDCSQTNLPQLNNEKLGEESNMRDNIIYMPLHWYLNKKQVLFMASFVNKYSQGEI
jgi:dTDP-4-amino-4,6-dideoxygalactose transaminase